MLRWRLLLVRSLLAAGAVALLDVGSSLTWLSSGRIGVRPLPPFGVELDPSQEVVLQRLERGEPGPGSVIDFDRELGWCVRPGAVHPSGGIHVNLRGARSVREHDAQPPPGVLRIACFGDSFTFGDEVEDGFTYQAFLERVAPEVEALNFGVPAYGTDQALLRMRREGLAGARAVVVGLLLENIGRNVNRYRPLWTPRTLSPLVKPRFVLEGDRLELVPQPFEDGRAFAQAVRDGRVLAATAEHEYWRDRPRVWTGAASSLGRLIGGWMAYRERDPRALWADGDGEPRRVTLALLDAFQAEARALGAREFLVLILPMRGELDAYERRGTGYWSELAAELEARGIAAVDLAPALAAEDARCRRDPARPTLFVAAHFSSHGNQAVAQEIQRWLVARKLLLPRNR